MIYTIGFKKTTAEHFFERLRARGVEVVLDIRLNNRSQLAGFAKAPDIEYKKYCVAGLDLGTGALVRLVSGDKASHGALSQQDLELAGCRIAGPLDVVRVKNVKPCPGAIQKENHRIDWRSSLSYVGHMTIEEVLPSPTPGTTTSKTAG